MGGENSLYLHQHWEELKATLWRHFHNDMEVSCEERTGVLFAKFMYVGLGRWLIKGLFH